MRIFILTGEPSGDLHGAHLASALRRLAPDVELVGVGGTRMREAGVRLVMDSEHWGVIGVSQAVGRIPALLAANARLARLLRADPPDVLVPIDFGAFNVRAIGGDRVGVGPLRVRIIRGLQDVPAMRIVYYIPPGCWSRTRRGGRLPWLTDAIATPFAWSAENLRAAGAPARVEFVGHPLRDYCRPTITRDEARARLGLDPARPTLAIVPGSRRAELRHILPAFTGAALRLTPAPQCLVAVAPSLGDAAMRAALPPGLDVRLLRGIDTDLIQAADAALVTSGTATLELALLGLPMVVAYRGTRAMWMQYLLHRRFFAHETRHIALPNILADADIVPELLQDQATPATLADAVGPLLADTPARRAQTDAFKAITTSLGEPGAVERTARMVLDAVRVRPGG